MPTRHRRRAAPAGPTRPARRRRTTALLLCLPTALALGACNRRGENPVAEAGKAPDQLASTTDGTVDVSAVGDIGRGAPLTPAQATKLSRALVADHRLGGADLTGTVVYGPAATFRYRGAIDWKTHLGHVVVTPVISDGRRVPDTDVYFTRTGVLTTVDGLEAAMAARGRSGVRYVFRTLDPVNNTLDRTLALIDRMASDRADNPILIRQNDTGYLGASGGVERFRSASTWFDLGKDGRVLSVTAKFKGIEVPLRFDFSAHGPRTITAPPAEQVVDAREVPDVMTQLTGRDPSAPASTATTVAK